MKKISKALGLTLASLGGLAVASAGLLWYKMKTDSIDLDEFDPIDDEDLENEKLKDLTPKEDDCCSCCVKGCECGDCECCQEK